MNLKSVLAVSAVSVAMATPGFSAIVSFSDTVEQIAPPATVSDAAPANSGKLLAFDEAQNVLTTVAHTLDDGSILAAGTRVDSHMVFLNPDEGSYVSITVEGDVTFSGAIIGTISDLNGVELAASDYLGGSVTYAFSSPFATRGREGGDYANFVPGGSTVSFDLTVAQPGDWVRVLTTPAPVPVPAGAVLLLSGLGGLAVARRRKKA